MYLDEASEECGMHPPVLLPRHDGRSMQAFFSYLFERRELELREGVGLGLFERPVGHQT